MNSQFATRSLTVRFVACLCGLAGVAGCNDNPIDPPTAGSHASAGRPQSQATAKTGGSSFERNRVFQVLPVAKLAGQVTIDGKPPGEDGKLFVILTNPNHLEEHAQGMLPRIYSVCDADGRFAFGTYDLENKNDGVVAGRYVVTFVHLHKFAPAASQTAKSKTASIAGRRGGYETYKLPDALENLYSDPDRNAKLPAFQLDLEPPGKDDYHFDLVVAGKEPLPKPAPHAVTSMVLSKDR